jgi:hypothetical protein
MPPERDFSDTATYRKIGAGSSSPAYSSLQWTAREAECNDQLLAGGDCGKLRSMRLQGKLTLRQVEERSLRFVQQKGNQSFQISASWLDRLEREEHELTVNKLADGSGRNLRSHHRATGSIPLPGR